MVVFHVKFSKKRAVILAASLVLVVALGLLLGGCFHKKAASNGKTATGVTTNEDRIAYLLQYGWQVKPDPVESMDLMVPETLTDAYQSYEELQKQQGFSLADYCGKQVTRYTYTVTNYPDVADGVQANLYICESTVIAGDIICLGENGFQAGLTFPSGKS
ncbi:MAG: DUF4830 domain-containing protein [Clostridiales bacterium]|nr:DUF4830 domain-containing protein [Clostridiales bacterium]